MNSLKEEDPSSRCDSYDPEKDPTSSEIDLSVIFLPVVSLITFEDSKLRKCHFNFKLDSVLLTKVTLKIFFISRSFCCSNSAGNLK